MLKTVEQIIEHRKKQLEKDYPGPVNPEDLNYVIYARKSTVKRKQSEDEKQKDSIPQQIKECKRYIDELNSRLKDGAKINVVDILEEKVSAHFSDSNYVKDALKKKRHKVKRRDVFYDMLDKFKKGCYQGLIVWSPDRLARNMKDAGEIIDMLDHGVIKDLRFASFDYKNDSNGKLSLGLQFVMAKNYSDNLSVNVIRGTKSNFMKGEAVGVTKYGYRIINGRYKRDERYYGIVQQCQLMKLSGATNDQCIAFLKKFDLQRFSHKDDCYIRPVNISENILRNILYDSIYAGVNVYGNNVVDVSRVIDHPLDPDQYFALQDIKEGHNTMREIENTTNRLRGRIVCGYCRKGYMTMGANNKKIDKGAIRIGCQTPNCPYHIIPDREKLKMNPGVRQGKAFSTTLTEMFESLEGFFTKESGELTVLNKKYLSPLIDHLDGILKQRINNAKRRKGGLSKSSNHIKERLSLVEVDLKNDSIVRDKVKTEALLLARISLKKELKTIEEELTLLNQDIQFAKTHRDSNRSIIELARKAFIGLLKYEGLDDMENISNLLVLNYEIKRKEIVRIRFNEPLGWLNHAEVTSGAYDWS